MGSKKVSIANSNMVTVAIHNVQTVVKSNRAVIQVIFAVLDEWTQKLKKAKKQDISINKCLETMGEKNYSRPLKKC